MKYLHEFTIPFLLIALSQAAQAQHCPPIYQSFLSKVSVEWQKHTLRLQAEYTKSGGVLHDAYQAYVVAYLDKDRKQVPAAKGKDVLDPKATLVLHTQVIKRNAKGTFALDYSIGDEDLVKRVIKHMKLGEKDRAEMRHWDEYKDEIRIAIFVPFLDDKKYSNLKGLPKERHECNYDDDRALIFQTLPYRFTFMTSRSEDTAHTVWVRINGDKPVAR